MRGYGSVTRAVLAWVEERRHGVTSVEIRIGMSGSYGFHVADVASKLVSRLAARGLLRRRHWQTEDEHRYTNEWLYFSIPESERPKLRRRGYRHAYHHEDRERARAAAEKHSCSSTKVSRAIAKRSATSPKVSRRRETLAAAAAAKGKRHG